MHKTSFLIIGLTVFVILFKLDPNSYSKNLYCLGGLILGILWPDLVEDFEPMSHVVYRIIIPMLIFYYLIYKFLPVAPNPLKKYFFIPPWYGLGLDLIYRIARYSLPVIFYIGIGTAVHFILDFLTKGKGVQIRKYGKKYSIGLIKSGKWEVGVVLVFVAAMIYVLWITDYQYYKLF